MMTLPSNLLLKLVTGLCAMLMVALLVHDRNRWKSAAALRQEQLMVERAAHAGTVANYRAAAESAREADAANAARIAAAQSAINERTSNDFKSRIDSARADAERMRRQAGAQPDPSGGGAEAVPRLSVTAEGASQGTGKDGFPWRDRLIATEQAIQLDELIKWVRQQHAVSPAGE